MNRLKSAPEGSIEELAVTVVVAILTGLGSVGNYWWVANGDVSSALRLVAVVVQAVLLVITIGAAIRYSGRRSMRSPESPFYRIWTGRFAVIMISLLANLAVLVVLVLHLTGVLAQL
jgi:hypothetical protein